LGRKTLRILFNAMMFYLSQQIYHQPKHKISLNPYLTQS
jgi:hypothetical protein